MEKIFRDAEQQNSNELSQRIEQAIPETRISNMGWLVLVRLSNQGIFTITPISNSLCDLSGTDCRDEKHEFGSITWDRAIAFLQAVAGLREQSSTGAVDPVKTPIEEIDRLREPFGRDPLGRKAMKLENSATQSPEVFTYLSELLPVDSATIANGELVLGIDSVKIVIVQEANGNFAVQSFVGGEPVQETQNFPVADLIRWTFQICGQIVARLAERDTKDADVDTSDVWSVIKELSREAGHGDDILRNKDLFDLKQGLCISRPPFDRSQSPDSFVGESSGSNHLTESFVRGARVHGGHPVRLCENDASKPFGNGLNGKKLVYILNEGATLVDADKLPPKMKLSWDDNHGAILVPETQPTKRPIWKFSGWK